MREGSKIALSALLILLTAVTAWERNDIFKTPVSVWTDVAEKNPRSSRVHNNLGQAFADSGRFEEAIGEYKIALAIRKYNIDAYWNLGSAYESLGRLDLALPYYSFYCRYETSEKPNAVRDKTIACDRVAAGAPMH